MSRHQCPSCGNVFETNKMPASMECSICGARVDLADSRIGDDEPSGWDDHLEVLDAEKILEAGLSEEELEATQQATASYLRGQQTYAMARITWAALLDYNLTLGVQTADWLHAGKTSQTMMVAIVNGIIKQQLTNPRAVHEFSLRYLRSAGIDTDEPHMAPWQDLTEDMARKPMLIFSIPIALLADPKAFGW